MNVLEEARNMLLDFQNGTTFLHESVLNVVEKLSELEENIKPKSCDGCFFYRENKCWQTSFKNYITCERHTFDFKMVDRYKQKEKK